MVRRTGKSQSRFKYPKKKTATQVEFGAKPVLISKNITNEEGIVVGKE